MRSMYLLSVVGVIIYKRGGCDLYIINESDKIRIFNLIMIVRICVFLFRVKAQICLFIFM